MMHKSPKILFIIAMAVICALSFDSCKSWEYDVMKNGIHFKKMHQSSSGNYICYMTENHTIQGFPCEKGWIHFRDDWQLLSFQLSRGFTYNGTILPAHTWIHYPYHSDRTGYICAFPDDYEVQGYLCGGSGGYKGIHTGFYGSGKLRSFFPPEDTVVEGVACRASLFASIKLHENGSIKSCKLAEDHQTSGCFYKKGDLIAFDKSGKPLP